MTAKIVALAVLCAAGAMLFSPQPVMAHHSWEYRTLKRIAQCESRGDPTAVNWEDRHSISPRFQPSYAIGSFGKYQIWRALWAETILDYMPANFRFYAHIRPDRVREDIQFLVARALLHRAVADPDDSLEPWPHWGNC